jgi:glycosyltransferase involved in cell wall biosynthesis
MTTGSIHPPVTLSSGAITSVPETALRVEADINAVEELVKQQLQAESPARDDADSILVPRPTLSVVIPVYNERSSILEIIQRVNQLPIDKQVIVVDDGSTDGTREILQKLDTNDRFEIFFHSVNLGKGAALQTGFRLAEGDVVIVQDADQEYFPEDILKVIQPILSGKSPVVYGSRYLESLHTKSSWIHRLGNRLLTCLSNAANGQHLTDMETCYKAFRRDVLMQITIEQRRFGFEPEITAKLSKLGYVIPEVAVRYQARNWKEGKKIGIRDLWNAIYCIIKYRFC